MAKSPAEMVTEHDNDSTTESVVNTSAHSKSQNTGKCSAVKNIAIKFVNNLCNYKYCHYTEN